MDSEAREIVLLELLTGTAAVIGLFLAGSWQENVMHASAGAAELHSK